MSDRVNSMQWRLFLSNQKICIEEDGKNKGVIYNIEPHGDIGVMKVKYVSGENKLYYLSNLQEGLGFGPSIKSRSVFMKTFKEQKAKYRQAKLADDIEPSKRSSTYTSEPQTTYTVDATGNDSTTDSIQSDSVDLSDSLSQKKCDINDRLIGEAMKVHVSNLIAPADARCFRNLDSRHVKMLHKFYKEQSMCNTVLIGNIVGNIPTNREDLILKLQTPGKISIETLGGNHTRTAIQELLAEGHTTITMVTCRLYDNLSDSTALKLGFEHNVSNGLGKPTSFIDMCQLFRKEAVKLVGNDDVTNMSVSRMKEWKDILCNILVMDRKAEEFHNKYKVVLKLSRANNDVWGNLKELAYAVENGIVKHAPRGPLKITQLKDFCLLQDASQLEILAHTLETKDWNNFKQTVESHSSRRKKKGKKVAGKKQTEDVEISSIANQENVEKENEDSSLHAENSSNVLENPFQHQVTALQINLEKVKKELSKTKKELTDEKRGVEKTIKQKQEIEKELLNEKQKNKEMKHQIEEHIKEKLELEGERDLLDKKVSEMEECLKYYVQKEDCADHERNADATDKMEEEKKSLQMKVKELEDSLAHYKQLSKDADIHNKEVHSCQLSENKKRKIGVKENTQDIQRKKRKIVKTTKARLLEETEPEIMMDNYFAINQEVEGFWADDGHWYPAKILKETEKGFEIIFKDKVVKDLPKDEIRIKQNDKH